MNISERALWHSFSYKSHIEYLLCRFFFVCGKEVDAQLGSNVKSAQCNPLPSVKKCSVQSRSGFLKNDRVTSTSREELQVPTHVEK